ncbi:enkurin domain-containing protein 1-like [Liolophura sinensis]|uniref:enkurin domain-containing protein 1-like n=1 Tax=Liolophura sinensis TaxID=3198878 RepID=UPI003158CD17
MSTLSMFTDGKQFGVSRQYYSGLKSRDHVSENVRRMRQIQRKCKEREAASNQPVRPMWKSEKYKDVSSKIKTDIIEKEPLPPRPCSADFLRAHSRSGPPVKGVRSHTPVISPPEDKLTVPRAQSAADVRLTRNNINFVKLNGICAKHAKIPRCPSVNALDELREKNESEMQNYHRGEVPKYLRSRQKKWKQEEEERIANTPDPALPPGHKVLPEEERKQTLALLKQNENELLRQLRALPLCMDTVRVRNKRLELEGKLAEVEEAVKIFARPKVFVKVD